MRDILNQSQSGDTVTVSLEDGVRTTFAWYREHGWPAA